MNIGLVQAYDEDMNDYLLESDLKIVFLMLMW